MNDDYPIKPGMYGEDPDLFPIFASDAQLSLASDRLLKVWLDNAEQRQSVHRRELAFWDNLKTHPEARSMIEATAGDWSTYQTLIDRIASEITRRGHG